MCSIVKCDKEDCSNLTWDSYNEYGAYCFFHSSLTHRPRALVIRNKDINPLKSKILMMNTKDDFVNIKTKEKKIMSAVRRAPIPSSLDSKKTTVPKTYNILECCICSDVFDMDARMKCGHFVCSDCLDGVVGMACPVCNQEMSGYLISEEVVKDIERRTFEYNKYGF